MNETPPYANILIVEFVPRMLTRCSKALFEGAGLSFIDTYWLPSL